MNRRTALELDPSSWVALDPSVLSDHQRAIYAARRQAIELYVANASLAVIEASTGIRRGHLYRHLERCLVPHEDGRVFGWRALVPYGRVGDYRRIAKVKLQPNGSGAAGAMDELLQRHPPIADWIIQQVRARRVAVEQTSTSNGLRIRLRGLKHLHGDFLRRCRAAGLTAADYPFNAQRMGIRSLAKVVRAECLRNFGRGSRLAGATHLKGMPGGDAAAPVVRQVLDVV